MYLKWKLWVASPLLPPLPPIHISKPCLSVASSPHWKEVKEWLVMVWTFLKHGFDHFLKICFRVKTKGQQPQPEVRKLLDSVLNPSNLPVFFPEACWGSREEWALDLPVNKLTGTFQMWPEWTFSNQRSRDVQGGTHSWKEMVMNLRRQNQNLVAEATGPGWSHLCASMPPNKLNT